MKFRHLIALAATGLAVAQPALAHRMWMLPSTFTLSGDEQWITVDGAVSNDLFFPNHVPLNYENVTVQKPDGSLNKVEDGWVGKFKTSFDVHLDQQGTYRISEGGERWFAMWEENGERQRMRGSIEELKAAGLLGKEGVQVMNSQRRVETFVTLGAPSNSVFGTTGSGLELVPVTHPNDVFATEEATFQIVNDGKPVEGLEIAVSKGNDRYRNDAGIKNLKTDADGKFSFTPEEAGRYWISTSVRGEGEYEGQKINVGHSYVVTIEALPL